MVALNCYLPTWQDTKIANAATIKDALHAISKSGGFMACICDDDGVLKAIVTDSDVRRALLQGADITDNAIKWAQKNPVTAPVDSAPEELFTISQNYSVREVPLVDENLRLKDIFIRVLHDTRAPSLPHNFESTADRRGILPNYMLILAGGLGTRLRPIVSDRPKPLAVVGNRPIIETLILQAVNAGIRNFFVAVNYMSEQIERHLSEPQYANLNIQIVRESKQLGTAGALGLIANQIHHPVLVCNADVLTTVPFQNIVRYHLDEGAQITCTVRPYKITVPFGVVDIHDKQVVDFVEKPHWLTMVNAGIYVLSPESCNLVGRDEKVDMPDVIRRALRDAFRIAPFFLHEYWADVGRPDDFQKANQEYLLHFGDLSSDG